jgi:sterol desaturase/sphingolipid hydroxylase (fatty acid hydroxylase superfamily)
MDASPLMAGSHKGALLLPVMLMILFELLWLRRRGRPGYDWRESSASLGVAIGNGLMRPLTALALLPLFELAYDNRLLHIEVETPLMFVATIVVVDFAYYWVHRASHAARWLWATHSVHHSSTRFNLSCAYRLGWTDLVSGSWMFLALLVWVGWPAQIVTGAFALNLAFQFFVHTETIGSLGPLERVFNTPAHHRVHHASNDELLDRNFGGIFIIWDRLFGTYAESAPGQQLQYGLHGRPASYNPVVIALGEWRRLIADLAHSRGVSEFVRTAVSKP